MTMMLLCWHQMVSLQDRVHSTLCWSSPYIQASTIWRYSSSLCCSSAMLCWWSFGTHLGRSLRNLISNPAQAAHQTVRKRMALPPALSTDMSGLFSSSGPMHLLFLIVNRSYQGQCCFALYRERRS